MAEGTTGETTAAVLTTDETTVAVLTTDETTAAVLTTDEVTVAVLTTDETTEAVLTTDETTVMDEETTDVRGSNATTDVVETTATTTIGPALRATTRTSPAARRAIDAKPPAPMAAVTVLAASNRDGTEETVTKDALGSSAGRNVNINALNARLANDHLETETTGVVRAARSIPTIGPVHLAKTQISRFEMFATAAKPPVQAEGEADAMKVANRNEAKEVTGVPQTVGIQTTDEVQAEGKAISDAPRANARATPIISHPEIFVNLANLSEVVMIEGIE